MRTATVALALGIGFLFSAFGSQALGASWSFEENTVPARMQFTEEEWALLEDKKRMNRPLDCKGDSELYFGIYERRYPEFEKAVPDRRERLQLWQIEAIATYPYPLFSCIVRDWSFALLRRYRTSNFGGFFYCGRWSRPAISPAEKRFQAAVEWGLPYVETMRSDMLFHFLTVAKVNAVRLNADVEYFLRTALRQSGDFDAEWPVGHLLSELSEKRIAELDAAIARRDLDFVLETTPSCPALPLAEDSALRDL